LDYVTSVPDLFVNAMLMFSWWSVLPLNWKVINRRQWASCVRPVQSSLELHDAENGAAPF